MKCIGIEPEVEAFKSVGRPCGRVRLQKSIHKSKSGKFNIFYKYTPLVAAATNNWTTTLAAVVDDIYISPTGSAFWKVIKRDKLHRYTHILLVKYEMRTNKKLSKVWRI